MAQAKKGDSVNVHYTGTLDDGTVFDSSRDRDPLSLTIGEGKVIPGLEEAIIGMSPGESTTANIPANQAYGPRHDDLVAELPAKDFHNGEPPEIGECYRIPNSGNGDGEMIVTVTKIADSKVTIDANHPLAGQNLNFEIELISIG